MSSPGARRSLPSLWYGRRLAAVLLPLVPLSLVFHLLSGLRRALYATGILRAEALPVPVVVVGNLTVGGSGKTPLVLWLVESLRARGKRPGIISRGYAAAGEGARAVGPDSDPAAVGDEPLLLARRSGVPVFVGRDRVAAGRALLAAHPECDVIVADDGLQHYRLRRDVEIAVFDRRGAGNGRLLPAGPLREPLSRLAEVDAVVFNGGEASVRLPEGLPHFAMRLAGERFIALDDPARSVGAAELRKRRLVAVAGIGDPQRFFDSLRDLGLDFEARPFPDHHRYLAADLVCAPDAVILMTEKDAVKCRPLVAGEAWVLPVAAEIGAATDGRSLLDHVLEKFDGRPSA